MKKYRGLTKKSGKYEWVFGMPSYGYESEEIAEIGTPDGDFYEIDPETLGEETEYRDRHGKPIYTGDKAKLRVDGGNGEWETKEYARELTRRAINNG